MAAKLLHSLSDDNPELQKQIGCMTGIFQMFDRHQMIVSGKCVPDQSHSQRRTLPRQSQYGNGSLEGDFISTHQLQPAEMYTNKVASERQQFSTESSRASFSSSRSSSFSSIDYCRSHQPDPTYNARITFPETAFEDSRCSISPRLARQSADFRDIVKDSMIKEARGLSNKPTNKEENMSRAAKQRYAKRDSFFTTKGNQNVRDGMDESIKGLSKLHGTKYNEPEKQRMQSDYGYKSKEASRISYDGMEKIRFSFESRESLSTSKLRDLPRLSLDSRECSMRQTDCESLSNSQLKASLKRSCSTNEKGHHLREVLGSQQRQPPSVVAKLMGLTALPDSTAGSRNDKSLIKNCKELDEFDAFGSSSLKKHISDPTSPSQKEPDSPRRVTPEMKPISCSRIHAEPAPWKKADWGVSSLKQSSRHVKSPMRQPNPFPSVYSEIEKRFKDSEFYQSGKDLGALKQILESIRAKGLLESEKHEQVSDAQSNRKHMSALIKSNLKKATAGQDNARGKHTTEVTSRRDNSSRRLDSPIVIMKPISRPPRSETTKNINKDQAVSSDEKFIYAQHSTRPHQQPKDNTASSPRNLGSVSPRTRLKKLDLEKQIQAQSHSSDASKNRMQVSKQPTESISPGRKLSLRSSNLQQNGSQVRENLIDIKKLRSRESEGALASDGYTILDSKQEREATRSVRSSKLNGSRSPSNRASKMAFLASDLLLDPPSHPIQLDEIAPDHSSPVLVLDTSAYLDDQTTEEKQLTNPGGDVAESYSAYTPGLSSELAFSSEISRKKLLSIDSLVQKLKRLNSTHDESKTDYIGLLSDDKSPDNRYISEILLASGLLREFGSNTKYAAQLHPSGNLINPELFSVLEQTKSNDHQMHEGTTGANTDVAKSHRKLIFDTLNEILTRKLASNVNLADYSVKGQKLARKALNAKTLIKELCTEMEQLQPRKKGECRWGEEEDEKESDGGATVKDMLQKDVMQQRSDGMMFESGISEVVLDIERLIFKDMVNEIVVGDGVAYRSRPKSASGPGFRLLKRNNVLFFDV